MADYNLNIFVNGKDNGASGVLKGVGGALGGVATVAGGLLSAQVFEKVAGSAWDMAKDSVAAAGDFESGMNDFQVAVGRTLDGSGKSLGDFKELFLSLGRELPVSTADVEKAAVAMSKGGIDPAVIAADGLKRTIQFAAGAMNGDLVGAANVSAKTMQAWTSITDSTATKTEFLSHAQDLMTQATTAASTTVDQLFLGLSNVGGTARLAGLSFDETTTALAQLTPSFSSSADAGTSFKTFLSRLQPTTQSAKDAMSALGLTTAAGNSVFYDAQGKFIGMEAAAGKLHTATLGMSEAQKSATLQTIFGSDAIRAAAVFADQGAKGYDAIRSSIAQQSDVAQSAAVKQTGYNTALDNAKGSVEALSITVGSYLIPILTGLLNNTIAPAINSLSTFADRFFKAGDKVGFLHDSLNGILPGLGNFTSGLIDVGRYLVATVRTGDSLNDWLTHVPPAIQPVLQGFGLLIEGSRNLVNGFLGASDKVGFLATAASNLSPWLENLIITARSVAIGFGTGGFAGALDSAGQELIWWAQQLIPLAIGGIASLATSVIAWGVSAAPAFLSALQSMAAALVSWVVPAIPALLGQLLDLRNSVVGWILGAAPGLIDTLKNWAESIIGWVGPAIPTLLGKLLDLRNSVVGWILGAAPGLIDTLKTWSLAFLGWIETAYPALLTRFTDGTVQLVAMIGAAAPGIITKLGDWALALAGWVVGAVPTLLSNLGGAAGRVVDSIGAALPGIVLALTSWGAKFAAWVLEATPPLLMKLGDLATQMLAWAGARVPLITSKLLEWGSAFGDWIATKAVPYLQEKLPLAWNKISGWVGETTPKVVAKIVEWGSAFGDWIATKAVPYLQEKLPLAWNKISGWVGETTPKVVAKIVEWGSAFGDWIATKAIPYLQEKLPPLWDKISTWVGETTPKVVAKIVEWGSAFGDWIATKAIPYLQEKLPPLWDKISTWVGETIPKITAKLVEWGNAFGNWIADKAVPYLGEKLGLIWDKISGWAGEQTSKAAGMLKDFGTKLIDGIWDGIGGRWERLKSDFTSWLGFFNPKFLGVGDMTSVGNNVVEGMWKGISDRWNRFKTDLTGLFSGLAPLANAILQINSPSKVFQPVGAGIAEGTGLGVQNAAGVATGAVSSMAKSLLPAASAAVSSAPNPFIAPFRTPSGGGGAAALSGAGGGGLGGGNITVHVTVQGSVLSTSGLARDLVEPIRSELLKTQRRNGNLGFA